MKRTLIAAVTLLCLFGTAAAQRHVEFRWRGVYAVGDLGYAFNVNRTHDTVSAFMPALSGGFMFRKEAAVGLGFTYVMDPTGAFSQLPLYAELRSHFLRSRLTPYTALQVGYSLPVGASSEPPVVKIDKGGLYLGIEVGGRYAFSRSLALGFHAGYRMLHSDRVLRSDEDNVTMHTDATTLHMINLGVALHFSTW